MGALAFTLGEGSCRDFNTETREARIELEKPISMLLQ